LIATETPNSKERAKAGWFFLRCIFYGLLKCLISKIAELEKQVQLLASVVNTRGQRTSILTPFPATSLGNQLSGEFGNGWQAPRDPQVERDHLLANVPAAVSSTQASQTPHTSPEHTLVRPSAIMPRMIETVQLSSGQIGTLFQL
jgi:hypothetical protein